MTGPRSPANTSYEDEHGHLRRTVNDGDVYRYEGELWYRWGRLVSIDIDFGTPHRPKVRHMEAFVRSGSEWLQDTWSSIAPLRRVEPEGLEDGLLHHYFDEDENLLLLMGGYWQETAIHGVGTAFRPPLVIPQRGGLRAASAAYRGLRGVIQTWEAFYPSTLMHFGTLFTLPAVLDSVSATWWKELHWPEQGDLVVYEMKMNEKQEVMISYVDRAEYANYVRGGANVAPSDLPVHSKRLIDTVLLDDPSISLDMLEADFSTGEHVELLPFLQVARLASGKPDAVVRVAEWAQSTRRTAPDSQVLFGYLAAVLLDREEGIVQWRQRLIDMRREQTGYFGAAASALLEAHGIERRITTTHTADVAWDPRVSSESLSPPGPRTEVPGPDNEPTDHDSQSQFESITGYRRRSRQHDSAEIPQMRTASSLRSGQHRSVESTSGRARTPEERALVEKQLAERLIEEGEYHEAEGSIVAFANLGAATYEIATLRHRLATAVDRMGREPAYALRAWLAYGKLRPAAREAFDRVTSLASGTTQVVDAAEYYHLRASRLHAVAGATPNVADDVLPPDAAYSYDVLESLYLALRIEERSGEVSDAYDKLEELREYNTIDLELALLGDELVDALDLPDDVASHDSSSSDNLFDLAESPQTQPVPTLVLRPVPEGSTEELRDELASIDREVRDEPDTSRRFRLLLRRGRILRALDVDTREVVLALTGALILDDTSLEAHRELLDLYVDLNDVRRSRQAATAMLSALAESPDSRTEEGLVQLIRRSGMRPEIDLPKSVRSALHETHPEFAARIEEEFDE